jgi:hypothetical protein
LNTCPVDTPTGTTASGCCFPDATTATVGKPHVLADRRFDLGVAAHEAGHIVAAGTGLF